MHELIANDLHNIANRLRQINPRYAVFRNKAADRVEVHNSTLPCAMSLQFVVPFDYLDERTLEYAQRTRIENFDAIEAEHAEANAEIEKSAKQSIRQSAYVLGDMMRYAGNQIHEVVFKKSKKWF